MTSFPVRMALRETRAAWRHFLYFFVCIALGVGTLVGVALFAANLERTIMREARGLLGGDLEARLTRLLGPQGRAVLDSLPSRGIQVLHVTELVAMAASLETNESGRPGGPGAGPRATQIVELKAVEPSYPLYGTLKVEPALPLLDLLSPSAGCPSPRASRLASDGPGVPFRVSRLAPRASCYGALVQESLLIRMNLEVGDRIKIGQASFTITGVILKEPDRVANLFSLGPRVLISREGLDAAELIRPGSRIRERYLLRVPPGLPLQPLLHELGGRLAPDMARVSTYKDAQPQLKNFLEQLTRYLGLVGLIALFVGGIGVATSVRAFVRDKLDTIAILKTVGAASATVIRTYLLQALLLGLVGSVAGAGLGVALQHLLPPILAGLLGPALVEQVELTPALSLGAALPIAKGIALGVLTTLLFTLWPLLTIRDVRPALIFRREVMAAGPAHPGAGAERVPWRRLGLDDRVRLGTGAGIAGGLALLAVWQAGSWTVGLLFIGGLAAAVVLLLLAAVLLVRLLQRAAGLTGGPRSLAVRQGIANLYRPGSQAAGVMVSMGIGVMVIVSVSLMEGSLVRQVGESRPADAPTFFFIDIQPDQKDGVGALIRQRAGVVPVLTPLVRSRLAAIDGRPVSGEESDEPAGPSQTDRRKRWYVTREYVLTFLEDLPKDNDIVKGRWWARGERPGRPLVSVEEEAARHLGVDVGSTLTLDIQGAQVTAAVSSIRKVEWGNFSTNFYMILSPGALDGAPVTYVGTVRVARDMEVPLQQAVVAAYPNVTAINIVDVMESFVRILDRLSLAIRAIALFCILAGAIVMAAALATTRYRRLYESVIFKALGATRGLIARAFATEYALLGAAAGLIGILLANVLSWAVLTYFLEVPWIFQPAVLAGGFGLTVALALLVGFLSTFRLLGQPPLSVLRHE